MPDNANQFLPFGTGSGANVINPALWASDTRRLTGMESGMAKSDACNTVWRQAMFVAAMIAQFTADYGPADVLDDGNLSVLENNFLAALGKSLQGLFNLIYEGTDAGTANHLNVTALSPALTTLTAGKILLITKGSQANTGAVLADIVGTANIPVVWDDGVELSNGDWSAATPALLFYNGTNLRVLSFLHSWTGVEGISISNTLKQIALSIDGLTALSVISDPDELALYQAEDEGSLSGGHNRKITVRTLKNAMPTLEKAQKFSAFTQYALTEISGYPYVDNVAQSLSVSGVTYLDVAGACSIFYNNNSDHTSGIINVVSRVVLYNGATLVYDSDIHIGATINPGFAAPMSVRQVFQNLDPAITYTVKMVVSQGGGTVRADPLNVNDAYIIAYGGK